MQFDIRQVPKATRTLLLIAVLLFLIGLVIPNEYLTLAPGTSIFWIWTFFTAGLWESNVILLVLNLVGLVFAGKYFERIWTTREFVRFVAVVNVGAYVGVFFATVLEYAVTMDSSWLFTSQAHGMGALMSGFIIAFKQTVPEHSIRILNTISLRSKHLPSLYICLNFLLFALRIIHVQFFVVAFGTIVSWVYMRFFKRQEGIRGDRSETFSFASFFPDMLHPFIKPISNSVYKIFISLRCLPPVTNTLPLHATAGQGGLSQPPPNTTGPGYADTERRKAIALRALDMKLAGVTESVKKPEAQPPALNEPAQIGSTTSNGE